MTSVTLRILGIALVVSPAIGLAQNRQASKPTAAFYITKEEVDTVAATPGIDHTIRVMDIGDQHFSVGIIRRGKGAAVMTGDPNAAPSAPAPNTQPCGDNGANVKGTSGIAHDKQTEGYYIVSGGGDLVTGGRLVNGRTSAPESDVTTTLNGPSCSGVIGGTGMVTRTVKVGDIVIIPAGVPHGWSNIPDHVDYLSFRPSSDILTVGYTHPSIKK